MNLEEELSILNNSVDVTSNVFEPAGQAQSQSNVVPNQFQGSAATNSMPSQQPGNYNTAQPSVVNLNQAQQQTSQFNFAKSTVNLKESSFDRSPLQRLSGNIGDVFRLHLLPQVESHKTHTHYNAKLGKNFICLKDAYGTNIEPCCSVYGDAKAKFIIPVVVMPITHGQPNNLLQGQPATLSALVLGPSQLEKLKEQVKFAGFNGLEDCDIIASVDSVQYKSFNFAIANQSFMSQIPNINELITTWNTLATPENIFRVVGVLIDRDTYNAAYADYDRNAAEAQNRNETPVNGQLNNPSSVTINTPYSPYGNTYTPNSSAQQPFYYNNQSQTNVSPWNN